MDDAMPSRNQLYRGLPAVLDDPFAELPIVLTAIGFHGLTCLRVSALLASYVECRLPRALRAVRPLTSPMHAT